MAGGYHFKRVQVSGERYQDKPAKDEHSHVADSLQYLLLGGGEGRSLRRRPEAEARFNAKPIVADTSWSVWR